MRLSRSAGGRFLRGGLTGQPFPLICSRRATSPFLRLTSDPFLRFARGLFLRLARSACGRFLRGGLPRQPFPFDLLAPRDLPFLRFARSLFLRLSRSAGGRFLRGGGLTGEPFPVRLVLDAQPPVPALRDRARSCASRAACSERIAEMASRVCRSTGSACTSGGSASKRYTAAAA